MIRIQDKKDCCGCSACVQRCPMQCITMHEDEEGFLYPKVDKETCIDCGLCEKVCPIINQSNEREPLDVFAAINTNEEVRMQSSSGGIFSALAESVLDEGGVVFGACFDERWEVVHSYVEDKDSLAKFRGSKYVQSKTGETYKQAEVFLKDGRKVLYSGTPCQIAGVKKYLRKDYDNLLTIEVVCHGVPSPLVWRNYMKSIIRSQSVPGGNTVSLSLKDRPVITGVSFRDKVTGWRKFGFVVSGKSAFMADQNSVLSSVVSEEYELVRETIDKNLYMSIFLHDLDLRPSCYKCPAKGGKSGSDISLADFWGIWDVHPEFDDDKGVSAVLASSRKGQYYLQCLNIKLEEQNFQTFVSGNPAYYMSVKETVYSKLFWIMNSYHNKRAIEFLILIKRIIDKLCRIIK